MRDPADSIQWRHGRYHPARSTAVVEPGGIEAIPASSCLGSPWQLFATWGLREGRAQLVLSRTAFGSRGNILPAGINTVMAGLGWFAVNSVIAVDAADSVA